jgi:diguanylate cyclase (GGDEF)-like protein
VCSSDLVNDTFGHLIGDKVLQRVSEILCEQVRNSDVVARIGGEEFAIFLPRTELANAEQLAQRIRQTVAAQVFEFGQERMQITLTLGVSQFHSADASYEDVLIRVDRALYHGKDHGRNKWWLLSERRR